MTSLYMVMLGGRHAHANTEVHDVVLAVGDELEHIYPQLKQAWFAEQQGLHIDTWAKIQGVVCEGISYKITFSKQKNNATRKTLYLINLGGYSKDIFGELHRYELIVADDMQQAKQIAKKHIEQGWYKPHTDRILDIDDCILINQVDQYFVELVEGEFPETIWENTYITI